MSSAEESVRRILKVLLYIEEHIEEEMMIEQLAKISCYSPFHFHRIFHMVVGETVVHYVRRLRMEKAATKLRYSNHPITEIAMETQYDTPSAFTRAFKQTIGLGPREYRTLHKEVIAMEQKIANLPEISPEKVEERENGDLLFIRSVGDYSKSGPRAWEKMHAFIDEMGFDRSSLRYFGITHDDPHVTGEEKLRYDACIMLPKNAPSPEKIGRQQLKGGKYAVFVHNGSYEKLGDTIDAIFFKWLPKSKETIDETRPCFSEYHNVEFVKVEPSKLLTKIFIPIR